MTMFRSAPACPARFLLLPLAVAATGFAETSGESADGPGSRTEPRFVSLFNGKDLKGWSGAEDLWSVEDGVIVGRTTDEHPIPYNQFLIWTDGEVDDFELKLETRISSGNSGIQIRSFRKQRKGKDGKPLRFAVGGYQADLDAAGKWAGTLYGEGYGGILAKRGERAVLKAEAKPGKKPGRPRAEREVESLGDPDELGDAIRENDWNEVHIIARGNRIRMSINGTPMSEIIDERPEARAKGLLAFQLHRGAAMEVAFRNIRLKRLPLAGDRKKVVFIAGPQSHAKGAHEHNAGCLLLSSYLDRYFGERIVTNVYLNGWPRDTTAIQNADAIVMYCDGQTRHVGYWHRRQLNELRDRGVGFGAIHYAVEMKPDASNRDLISWIGGAFEVHYSVNPHWDADFTSLPDHPVARGVNPFTIRDEWYFNMRFAETGVTPILSAVPPPSTMNRKDGHHSGNPIVRELIADGIPQHVCWVYDRPDGGRGFGFTGGHFHANWQHDDFRKTVLNAIAWIAGVEVPEMGVQTPTPSDEVMEKNLDPNQRPARPRKKTANR